MNIKKTLITLVLSAFAGCGKSDAEGVKLKTILPPPKFSNQYISVLSKEYLTYNLSLECSEDKIEIFITPERKRRLHFYEAKDEGDFSVKLYEYLVMTDSVNQFTHVLEYSGVDDTNKELWFWDMSSYQVMRIPYDPATNTAYVNIANIARKINFNPVTKNISVDQNGDGVFNGEQSPIVYYDDKVLLEEDLLR